MDDGNRQIDNTTKYSEKSFCEKVAASSGCCYFSIIDAALKI